MDWFSEWFDSPYYHILYKNRDEQEAERFIDALCTHLQLPTFASIIDIPCGKGRHSIYLHKKGYTVQGADLSPESIKHAKAFEQEGLFFFNHDMREPFAENKYDAVLNIFTSFGYFDDKKEDIRCIKAFVKGLKPGGILVIDFLNVYKAVRNLQKEDTKIIDGIHFLLKKESDNRHIRKIIQFEDKGRSYSYQEQVALLTKEDFLAYFEEAGLSLRTVFGDYQLSPFNKETSDRLILIAQK